ncbi:MAG: hypothetical protein R3B52_03290, partial [Candidatus Paceibacterota bacterium]
LDNFSRPTILAPTFIRRSYDLLEQLKTLDSYICFRRELFKALAHKVGVLIYCHPYVAIVSAKKHQ